MNNTQLKITIEIISLERLTEIGVDTWGEELWKSELRLLYSLLE